MTLKTPYIKEVAQPSLKQRIVGLDELRGLSILWVFICHGTALTTWIPRDFGGYGYHGVVLFFVISGYLITRILLESKTRDKFFSRFYLNRLFRIWPLMLLALLASALIWPAYSRSALLNFLLVNNYGMAVGVIPPMRTDVMWSLAIEEQFYLFWPLIVWFLNAQQTRICAAILIFFGLLFDSHIIPGGHMIMHKTTHATMQYIAMGALVALGRSGLKSMLVAWGAFMATWLVVNGPLQILNFRWYWYGISFALGLLVYWTVHQRPLLQSKILADLGKLCYGIYLIHFFCSAICLHFLGQGIFITPAAYVLSSLILAILSYKYFELPIQNLRVRFYDNLRAQVLLFGTMLFVVLASIIVIVTTSRPAGFVFE
jgi:peptidoglycan/LPS O-acetylase OafA/YrhL